jgi:hypothetical protein
MTANLYPTRQNRLFAAGAAVFASTMVLSGVLMLFAGAAPTEPAASTVIVQQPASGPHA